jgi:hypothetical protein
MTLFKVGDKVTHIRSGISGTVIQYEDKSGQVRVKDEEETYPIDPEGDWILNKPLGKEVQPFQLTQTYGRYYGNLVRRLLFDAGIPWVVQTIQMGRPDMLTFYVSKSNHQIALNLLER